MSYPPPRQFETRALAAAERLRLRLELEEARSPVAGAPRTTSPSLPPASPSRSSAELSSRAASASVGPSWLPSDRCTKP